MSKVNLELDSRQIEALIERLPTIDKIRIVYKLEQETLCERWNGILRDIDKRLKRFPISKQEVAEEINAYRKEKYAKGCR